MRPHIRGPGPTTGGTMPQYMLLIYSPSDVELSPEARPDELPLWNAFTQSLRDAGQWLAGDALYGVDAATTVRVRNGETIVTDGPFAETKEYLAGYYVLDCRDLDTALAHAARVPNVGYGSIEVRPVVDMSAYPAVDEQAHAAA